jgi:pilus assembly protein CpaF
MQDLLELKRLIGLPGLNDLVINGAEIAQADFGEGLIEIENPFLTNQAMSAAMSQLALSAGARLDIAKPIADFSLLSARFHAVLAQGVSSSPLLSIRKHHQHRVSLNNLVEAQMLSEHQAAWLRDQVKTKKSIVISGATSSGKTTLLRALLGEVQERVIAIEQTPELMLSPPAVCLTERIANQEGVGAITLDELVVHALRMRPDRIVVGEVRSKEFQVLLQAINNGHLGTMTTLHASGLSQVAERALILGMLSGLSVPLTNRLFSSSIDLVIQLSREGNRRVVSAIGAPDLVAGEIQIIPLDIS